MRLAVLGWSLSIGLALAADPLPRVVDVRVGRHASFDRLVLEIERPAVVHRLEMASGKPFVLEIGVQPLLLRQRLATGLRRMGPITIERTASGARIRADARARRIRSFVLSRPVRVVIDFAEPGKAPFRVPASTRSLARWAASRTPDPGPERASAPAKPPSRAAVPSPKPPSRVAVPSPKPPSRVAVPSPKPPSRAAVPSPKPPSRVAVPSPKPPSRAAVPAATPSLVETLREQDSVSLWMMAGLGLLFLVGLGLAGAAWRRVRASRASHALARARVLELSDAELGDVITPQEVAGSDVARLDIMDRRLDEEVRARMLLEERMTQLHGELKVIRDRLQRVARVEGRTGG